MGYNCSIMNIIFVDGKIPYDGGKYSDKFKDVFKEAFGEYGTIIVYVDAANGVNKCQEKIENCFANGVKYVITNDIVSWGNQEYSWDDIENKCCAYIYYDDLGEIFSVEELTDKEIRKSNNLEKMYLNGAFTKPHKLKSIASKIISAVKGIGNNMPYKDAEKYVVDAIANSDFLPLGAFLQKLTGNSWIRIFEAGKLIAIHENWLENLKNRDFVNNYFINSFDVYDDALEIYVKRVY